MSVPTILTTAAGMVVPALANKFGIGKNDTRAKTFDESAAYDPNAGEYGHQKGLADQTANDFAIRADQAQQRQAAQAGLVGVNYQQANGWQQGQIRDRSQQGLLAGMMMARAQGQVPSIAGQQAALDMQRAAAAQSSAAASARGAAGLALAGQNAANNTSTMQSAISNNAQINAANERLAAEQGAYGAYSGIRAGDAQAQAQAAQQAQYAAQLGAQQNQFNAGLAQQQHGLNDAYSANMYGQMNNVRQMQMNGALASQGLLSQSQMNATNQNVAISQNNANREYQYYQQAMGALGGGLQAGAMQGTPAPPAPQPATGVGAPTSGYTPGGSTNMVGIPQAGTGSDDRMKSGITPLGLLGVYGGGGSGPQNPTSGPVGGGGYGSAPSSYEVLSNGGENVAASGDAMSRVATQYATDPTGGMQSGGLLSDERAKQAAFDLGMAQGRKAMRDDMIAPLVGGSVPEGSSTLEKLAFANASNPLVSEMMAHNPYIDEARDSGLLAEAKKAFLGAEQPPEDAGVLTRLAYANSANPGRYALERIRSAIKGQPKPAPSPDRAPPTNDPATEQFAAGLAPIRFEYKPGMGPPGQQTGIRAQGAAAQPLTASMVTRRPDGLLQIDPRMGLSTALAASGNNAQKQLVLEDRVNKLEGLLAASAAREGY